MKEVILKDWKTLVNILDATNHHINGLGFAHFQFRGQSNKDWKIDSSLKRIIEGDEISEKKALYYEKQARNEFLAQMHLVNDKGGFKDTMLEMAAFIDMQHYSCPTRVVDWSTSPYVALYFAVNENMNEDGALFIWNSASNHLYLKSVYPDFEHIPLDEFIELTDTDCLQLVFATRKNERLVRQQGSFSLSNNIMRSHCDLIKIVAEKTNFELALSKLIIPSSLKIEFLARLRGMNISAASLFPGIDGLGKSIKESLLLRKWSKK